MFCKNCGAALIPEAAFCEDCGTAVGTAVRPTITAQPPKTNGRPAPKKKSGSWTGIIIVLIVFMLVLFAVSAVAVLWFTGLLGGGGEPPETTPAQAIQTTQRSERQDASQQQNNPEQQVTPEQSKVEEAQGEGALEPQGESRQLSTTKTPTAEDFKWFTGKAERWVYGITPAKAVSLEDFYALLGSWKGLEMIYDYDGKLLGCGYFTATFSESGPNISAQLDWHHYDWKNGSHEEQNNGRRESMTGSFIAPKLALGEAGNRIELLLYAKDGKQYAEGRWQVQSGEEVRVALVRP